MQLKNIHLIISSSIVIPIAFIYGFLPEITFDVAIISKDEANIFKAIMGLYLAFGVFWIIGIFKLHLWKAATISNMLFMFGLAFGRIISVFLNGEPSTLLVFGLFGELVLGIYSYIILKNE